MAKTKRKAKPKKVKAKPTAKQTGNRRSPAEHLRPFWFKPGQSGNPAGRPKKRVITERLFAALHSEINKNKKLKAAAVALGISAEDTENMEVKELVALALIVHAVKGNAPIMKEVLDRIEGKVKEEVELSRGGAEPLIEQTIQQVMADKEMMGHARKLADRYGKLEAANARRE